MYDDMKPTTHFVLLNNTAKALDNKRLILSITFQKYVGIRLLAIGVN